MNFIPARTSTLFMTAIVFSFFSALLIHDVRAEELYFIDAHSQVDQHVKNLELIIQRMDETNVYCTILSARSKRSSDEIASFAAEHPDRIIPAVRTKSGAYNKNHPKYYKKMAKQLKTGHFKAMAEVLIYHAQKGDKAPEVVVFPNDERVVFALNEAITKGWPFVIHMEFQSLKGSKRQQFMAAMEKMLKTHPNQPFALNHLGQLEVSKVRRLINTHPNIHFLTSHANPGIIKHSRQPWVNMFAGKTLAPEWKKLVIQHPDRFIFALDNVWQRHWDDFYQDQMDYWRQAMADLPSNVAHAVSHGNAERLWNIPPKLAH